MRDRQFKFDFIIHERYISSTKFLKEGKIICIKSTEITEFMVTRSKFFLGMRPEIIFQFSYV